jgi:hypothetical protein
MSREAPFPTPDSEQDPHIRLHYRESMPARSRWKLILLWDCATGYLREDAYLPLSIPWNSEWSVLLPPTLALVGSYDSRVGCVSGISVECTKPT